jgi:hypothetical protein
VLLSVLFSWPWAALDGTFLPTRQFDLYGTVWLVEHARLALATLRSPVSGLPDGEDLHRLDTWVLAALGALTSGWLDPVRLLQAVVLAGPVLSAVAAERCAARGFGVRPPWSLVAGVIYGFSGLGATALLEGHVYYLLDPWLPLLLWALLAANGPGGRLQHGLAAGAAWALALGTSAYLGIVGAILAAVFFARGAWIRLDRRPVARALAGFVAAALPVGALYALVFRGGSAGVASDPATVLAGGSATLASLATWSPAIELDDHSIAAPLGFVTLALVAVAPVVLAGKGGWRTLAGLAVASVVLALGPTVQTGMGGLGTWYWVDLRGAGANLAFLHFPVRFLWLWSLCGGIVAAQVVDALAERLGARVAAPLLALVAFDALVISAVPLRVGTVPATIPSAYAAAPPDGLLLDLLAEDPNPGSGIDLWMRRLACYYQARHHRPVVGRCLSPLGAPPQEAAERALREALLDGTDPRGPLATLGVAAVAVHLDLFTPDARAAVMAGLGAALGPPAATSTDGGETVALFRVPP